MSSRHRLADLQLAIMNVLWARGEATVAEVRQSLSPGRKLAHTTVATMLTKLESKGAVAHRSDGRMNIYRPTVERDQVSRTMIADLAERLFAGDVEEMMCHLFDECEISKESLARLTKIIRQKEKELEGHD
ncbi:MAG: BlaI/MecI/CopY family transcriptional regulator [Pirellulales bacterium]